MKIALCLEYPLAQHGGVEVLVSELVRGLGARHEILLVSPDDAASLAKSDAAPFVKEHISFSPVWNSVARARNLAEKIARAKPDMVHFHSGGAYGWGNRFPFRCPIIYLNRLGVPCVSTVHSAVNLLDGYCGPQKPFWFKLLMLPLAWLGKMQQLSNVHFEIAVSRDNFQKLCRRYFPFRKKFVQIYHSRLSAAAPLRTDKRDPIILSVGYISKVKGQIVLAQAFAQIAPRHPEWSLQLAGYDTDDDSARQILRLIATRGLEKRVFLLGDRSDTFDLMCRAAIYVQPSFYEALGLALQEAMFYGCACIGSRAGGIPELIRENKTGLLCEAGNVEQLARLLEKLIVDEALRENFGRAAAASIRQRGMTAGQMTENYLHLYESIRR